MSRVRVFRVCWDLLTKRASASKSSRLVEENQHQNAVSLTDASVDEQILEGQADSYILNLRQATNILFTLADVHPPSEMQPIPSLAHGLDRVLFK